MKKLHFLALGALLVVFVIAASALLARGQGWGDDFAQYVMQAKSILNGTERQTIAENVFAIDNSSQHYAPSVYPWGYPLVLSLFYLGFGLNPIVFNSLNILFLCLFIIFFFMLLRNRLSPLEAVLVIAVVVFAPEVISYENNITSDIAFLAVSFLSILLIDRFVSGDWKEPASLGKNIALGGTIFLAFLIRGVGILLLSTLMVCQIIAVYLHSQKQHEHKKVLINFLVPYLVFGILWGIFALLFPSGQGYVNENLTYITNLFHLSILKDHVLFYFHAIDQRFISTIPLSPIVYGFLLAFFMIGIIAGVEKDYAFIIYSVLMIPVLLVYPNNDNRYIFPILPFFVYFSFQGMRTGFMGLRDGYHKAGQAIMYIFWIGVLLFFANALVNLGRANLASDR